MQKIKSFVKTYFWPIVITIFIALGIILRLLTPKLLPILETTSPTATPSATPTIQQSAMTPPTIFPASGDFHAADTYSGITLVFPIPVNPSTIQVNNNPSLNFKVTTRRDNPNLIILSPQNPWVLNTNYQITISSGITAIDNSQVLRDQIQLNYHILEIILETYPEEREGGF